jgi:hypothetical protein
MRGSRPVAPDFIPERRLAENAAMLPARRASIIQSERFMNQVVLESCAK